jgi:hypothetical protein
MSITPVRWAPLLLIACQDPFGADRHDLNADRIAAITTAPTSNDDQITLNAWLVSGGSPWSDGVPDVRWFTVDSFDPEVNELDADATAPLGEGPVLTFDRRAQADVFGRNALGLVVRFPSGAERRAELVLPAGADPLPGVARLDAGLLSLDFDEATEEELALDARRSLEATALDAVPPAVPPGRWSRLGLAWDARPAGLDRVRWMSTSRTSTFLELDADTTDWATGELVLDDLEIESATPLSPGPVTMLALAVNKRGMHRAVAAEVWVGDPEPGIVTRGRWLAAAPEVTGAVISGTLVADDEAPTGLRLEEAAAAALDAPDPWGTADLTCNTPVSGPFDPTWLFDGSCARDQVVGRRVAVEVE